MLDPVQFGKDVGDLMRSTVAPLIKRIEELEAREPEVIKGIDGKDGKDADPVEISHDDILTALKSEPELLREVVAEYLTDNPPPAGEKGEKGEKGDPGESVKGDKGDAGEKGADGIGATGAMIDKDGELIITLGNGTLQRCGKVVGSDGKDGADLSDISFEYDGERTINVKAKGGEVVSNYRLPVIIDKGYWRKGDVCEKGDCVTRDGALWISQADNNRTEPNRQNKEYWRLGVRKGRDGAKGKDGKDVAVSVKKPTDDEDKDV